MIQTSKEYAEALFSLALEENCVDEFSSALTTIYRIAESEPDYVEFLASPAIPLSEKTSAIDEAFGGKFPVHIISFLKVMCENGHARALCDCIKEFAELTMSASGKAIAEVISAAPLTNEQKDALTEKLSKMINKTVEAIYTVDSALIGGIKIEIEGKTYDGSINKKLHSIKEVIIG